MKILSVIVLLLVGFCANQAFAFACRSYPDRNEIDIKGFIGHKQIPFISDCPLDVIDPRKPAVYFLSSEGGDIDKINVVVRQLRSLLRKSLELSGVAPTVVVHEQCQSACIPVLSALNKMAKENKISLVVDPNTIIGFHGCSDRAAGSSEDDPGVFSVAGTARYITYWQTWGGNIDWVVQYWDFFDSADLHQMKIGDPRLEGANLVEYAIAGEAKSYRWQ